MEHLKEIYHLVYHLECKEVISKWTLSKLSIRIQLAQWAVI